MVLLTAGFWELALMLAFHASSIDFVTVGVTSVMSLTHPSLLLLVGFLFVVVASIFQRFNV